MSIPEWGLDDFLSALIAGILMPFYIIYTFLKEKYEEWREKNAESKKSD